MKRQVHFLKGNGNMRRFSIFVFEDEYWEKLRPITLTHPTWEIRSGMMTNLERMRALLKESDFFLQARDYMEDYLKECYSLPINALREGEILLLNGALKDPELVIENEREIEPGRAFLDKEGRLLFVLLLNPKIDIGRPLTLEEIGEQIKEEVKLGYRLPLFLWDVMKSNGERIVKDFELLGRRGVHGEVMPGVHMVNPKDIYIGRGAKIKPGVVLDAEEGPIYIGDGTLIGPNAVLSGPVAIGEKSFIKMCSKIEENTSTGPVTKLGGEVEATIFQGYSNKQHEGFLGHSYIGSWVNLGADTNNSDLKNTYGPVRVDFFGESLDTGEIFVGLFMGDHSKSGINTMFNTGTIVGVASNIYGGDYPPKFIPSFAWGGSGGFTVHGIEKAIVTAKRVMARRKVELTPAYEKMMRRLFDMTEGERRRFLS